jgi:uncharacterized protein (TIGR01370 family)
MRKGTFAHALALGTMLVLVAGPLAAATSVPWVVYYSKEVAPASLLPYEVIVLDSDNHPPLQLLQDRGKVLLGYLSLGEVADYRHYFGELKQQGILLHEHPVWKGSFYVDLRNPGWTSRVIEDLVPAVLDRGFQGLFLDTLDDAKALENADSERFRGMTDAAVQLVRAIRLQYPQIIIMLNRAYDILPEVATCLDMALGESVYADYDFKTKAYGLVDPSLYQWQVSRLKEAQGLNPKLQVMTLDYWDPADSAGVAKIYKEQRANGFSPYVATINLDVIVPEPGS